MATGISVQIAGQTVNLAIGETYASIYGEADQNFLFGAGEGITARSSDEALAVGPLVTAQVPCAGGAPLESSLPSVTLPSTLGSVGVITSTAEGTRNGLTGNATTSSEAAGVALAGGLVTADVISSTSHAETADGGQTVSTTGTSSTFVNLSVAGVPIAVDTPINTVIQLPGGLGYVVVNGRTEFESGVETIPLLVHLAPVGPVAAVDLVVARSFAFVLGPNTSAAAEAKAMALLTGDDTLQSAITDEITTGEVVDSGVAPEGLDSSWTKDAKELKAEVKQQVKDIKTDIKEQVKDMKAKLKDIKNRFKNQGPQ